MHVVQLSLVSELDICKLLVGIYLLDAKGCRDRSVLNSVVAFAGCWCFLLGAEQLLLRNGRDSCGKGTNSCHGGCASPELGRLLHGWSLLGLLLDLDFVV